MKIRNFFISTVLVSATASASALGFGAARGAAVLGQPLVLTVDVKADSSDEMVASCFEAVVMLGEGKLDASKVRLTVSDTAGGGSLKLVTTVVVDEPTVAVTLRGLCESKVSRRYVLLTELSSATSRSSDVSVVVSSSPVAPPKSGVPRVVVAPAPGAGSMDGSIQPSDKAAVAVPPTATAAKPMARPRDKDVLPAVRAVTETKKAPRLKLEPVDLSPAAFVTQLRSSGTLSLVPAEATSPQRDEARAVWAAMNQPIEQAAAQVLQLQKLQSDVVGLRGATVQAQVASKALEERLQEAEDSRYWNQVTWGLVALCVVLGGSTAWLLLRGSPRATALPSLKWWQIRRQDRAAPLEANTTAAAAGQSFVQPDALVNPPVADSVLHSRAMEHVDVELDLSESAFLRLEELGAASPAEPLHAAPVHLDAVSPVLPQRSDTAPVGELTPDDLFDVQQHAEFFVSLGQYDQAITALEAFIQKHPETSPLAYLDLLKLHHMLSQNEQFERVRAEFNERFSGEVPVFSGFGRLGQGLDTYPNTMALIEQAWARDDALNVLEDCIFHRSVSSTGESLDLEAFKDLLVLHALKATGVPAADRRSRVLLGDLSGAWMSQREASASTFGNLVPDDLKSAVPASGWDRYAPASVLESVLDLDLSEGSVLPATLDIEQVTVDASSMPEVDLSEPLNFEQIEIQSSDLVLDSPLDDPSQAVVVDQDHLIDFDVFEASPAQAAAPRDGGSRKI